MKIFSVIVLVLALTGCTTSSSDMKPGKVVSCQEISFEKKMGWWTHG
jgi:hypothetical protein